MLAGVREAWRPLRSQLLGERVLLAFDEGQLQGVGLRQGAISTPVWDSVLPARCLQGGMPAMVDVLGDFIGDLLLSQGLMGQPLRVALPPGAAHWRLIEWPFDAWPETPIEALRTLDPELGLPFALADAAIDIQPLAGEPLRSLLVAAPRALVEAWIAVMQLAGMPLERLLPAQVCLREALAPRLNRLDQGDGVVLIQPGSVASTLQFWSKDAPLYERLVPAEPQQLAEHIAALIAFYRSRDPAFAARQLWLTAPLPQQETLAAGLGLQLEIPSWAPYDAPVMRGLALVR